MDCSVLLWHIGSIAQSTRIVYRTTYEFIQHFFFIWQSKYLLSAFLYPLLAKSGALRPYFNLHKVCKFNTFENVS